MQSLNASSMFLHRSPSGVQRRIKQRLGNEWPVQKSTNLPNVNSSSTENLEPYEATTSSPNNSYNGHSDTNNLGYRSLIESSNYRSLLDDDSNSSIEPVEEKFSNWSLSNTQNKFSYLNGSSLSNSLNNALNTPTNTSFTVSPTKSPTKPTPLPRSHEQQQHVATPQSLALNGRQRHNSGLSSNLYNSSLPNDTSFGLSSTPVISKISLSTDLNGSQLPQSPIKPTVHVQPLSIPRVAKQQPPPVPEKPKSLQTTRLKSVELADKSTSSIIEFDMNQAYTNLDNEALSKMENQRISTLTNLYEKVAGRWEDLKNLHNEKKKNAELFQQTMEIAQRHGIPVTPFMRFVKRFENVYEVQTRLVLNKQQLRKNLETTQDNEFLVPLIEQNNSNTQDIERIVDELDATFRQLDGQLCEVLSPDEHERWVFFVRTLYSLIAEQTSIQFKVRYVTGQIKKLEEFSFKQLASNKSANTSTSSDKSDL